MDISDIFFLVGGGEGGVRGDREGGGRFFLLKAQKGGVSHEGGGGRGGREGVRREFGWGGGLNIFFRGRNARQGDQFVLCFHLFFHAGSSTLRASEIWKATAKHLVLKCGTETETFFVS